MAVQKISEVEWHGNQPSPRQPKVYASTFFIQEIASPYYKDGRTVPVFASYVTTQPLSDTAPPAIVIDAAGPGTSVAFTVGGIWFTNDAVSLNITVTGGTDYIDTVVYDGQNAIGPIALAAGLAAEITANSADINAVAVNETITLTIKSGSAATALTIVTAAPV